MSSTLLIMLKMAVLAPIPNAKVTNVVIVNSGVRARRRNVCFKAWILLPVVLVFTAALMFWLLYGYEEKKPT